MKPHKDQAGYKYIRIKALGKTEDGWERVGRVVCAGKAITLDYNDNASGSRIISSERVERAVETDDFIRRLLSEGLDATVCQSGWCVSTWAEESSGPTIRAAYENYRARIAHSASGGE